MCYATCQLSQTLLEFLLVVARLGSLDLCLDLGDTRSDSLLVAGTVDDGGILLADGDRLGRTEHLDRSLLQTDTFLLGDHGTTGQDGYIFQHLFAAVAEARRLDGTDLELRTQTVDNERRECFAIYVLSDDEQRTTTLYGRLQYGQQFLEVGDLLVVDQDIRFLHLHLHGLGVGHEVGADIAAVELHTLNDVDGGVHTLGLADGDDAVLRYFAHGVSDQATDLSVVVGADSSHLLDFVEVVANDNSVFLDLAHYGRDSLVDTALEVHRIGSGGNVLEAYAYDSLCQYGSRGGTITGLIAGLGGYLLD